MQVTLNTIEFRNAFDSVGSIVERVQVAPVLACVLLRARAGRMEIHATDLDCYGMGSLVCTGDDLALCCNADRVALFMSAARSETFTMTISGSSVLFRAGLVKALIPFLSAEDFPDSLGETPSSWTGMDGKEFSRVGRMVALSADPRDSRDFCKSVSIGRDGRELCFLATNGRTFARKRFGNAAGLDAALVFPRFFDLIPECPIEISIHDCKIWCRSDGLLVVCKTIVTEFPHDRVQSILDGPAPNGGLGKATADRASLLSAIKVIEKNDIGQYRPCHIYVKEGIAVVYASAVGGSIEVPFDADGDSQISVVANSAYIRAALEAIDAETVTLDLVEASRCLVSSVADPHSASLFVPLRAAPADMRPDE